MCERVFVAVVATFVVTVCFLLYFFFVVPLVSTRHTDALARDDTERVHKFDPTEAHGGKIRSPKYGFLYMCVSIFVCTNALLTSHCSPFFSPTRGLQRPSRVPATNTVIRP